MTVIFQQTSEFQNLNRMNFSISRFYVTYDFDVEINKYHFFARWDEMSKIKITFNSIMELSYKNIDIEI